MSETKLQFVTTVKKSPAEVIDFVSDVRNRATYQTSLASSDVEGAAGAGQTWKWRYELMGQKFEGTGKGVGLEPGKLFAFVTEGAIASRFTYRADATDDGTKLTVEVEAELPAALEQLASREQLLQAAQQKGNAAMAQLQQAVERR